jgi:UDP-glucose 4-epimerase
MNLAQHTVAVTGGAGFIGSHVVDRLLAKGAEVVVIDDLSVGTRENLADAQAKGGMRLVVGDVRDADLMNRELARVTVVIHMACDNLRASLNQPMHTHDVNATGSLVTALAAAEQGAQRYVYVSSSEAYGTARAIPMTEDHPLEPTTVYGASKAAGELYAQGCMRTYGLPAVVVRPFNSYGPREHETGTSAEVIPKFVLRLLAGEAPVIFGDGSQTRDFTWVEETAAGIAAAAECDALVGESVNIAFGLGVSIRDISQHLLEIMGRPDLAPEFDEPRPGDVDHHYADTTKARELVGFQPTVSVREGLERYVDWMRNRHSAVDGASPQAVRNW